MDLSCIAPVPETPEHVALAERLGYCRACVVDAPAAPLDVWMTVPAERPAIARELRALAAMPDA